MGFLIPLFLCHVYTLWKWNNNTTTTIERERVRESFKAWKWDEILGVEQDNAADIERESRKRERVEREAFSLFKQSLPLPSQSQQSIEFEQNKGLRLETPSLSKRLSTPNLKTTPTCWGNGHVAWLYPLHTKQPGQLHRHLPAGQQSIEV